MPFIATPCDFCDKLIKSKSTYFSHIKECNKNHMNHKGYGHIQKLLESKSEETVMCRYLEMDLTQKVHTLESIDSFKAERKRVTELLKSLEKKNKKINKLTVMINKAHAWKASLEKDSDEDSDEDLSPRAKRAKERDSRTL